MDDILREFLGEARDNLALLDDRIARLDSESGDDEARESAYRAVHTIKGTCGFLGLDRLERLATAGDLVLGRIYRANLAVTPAVATALRELEARIAAILDGLSESGTEPAGDDGALVARLQAAAGVTPGGAP